MECCGKAAAFVQRSSLAIKGRYRTVWWCANNLFNGTLREVALRAIGLTGASALAPFGWQRRSFRAAKTFGDKGPLPNSLVACEWIVQRDAA